VPCIHVAADDDEMLLWLSNRSGTALSSPRVLHHSAPANKITDH